MSHERRYCPCVAADSSDQGLAREAAQYSMHSGIRECSRFRQSELRNPRVSPSDHRRYDSAECRRTLGKIASIAHRW